jgi:hypothetical protein
MYADRNTHLAGGTAKSVFGELSVSNHRTAPPSRSLSASVSVASRREIHIVRQGVQARVQGRRPAILPSTAGSLPNDVFSEVLGLPTVWVPHSYRGCSQHGPDEHLPAALAREALALMAGIYWDLGEPGLPGRGRSGSPALPPGRKRSCARALSQSPDLVNRFSCLAGFESTRRWVPVRRTRSPGS